MKYEYVKPVHGSRTWEFEDSDEKRAQSMNSKISAQRMFAVID